MIGILVFTYGNYVLFIQGVGHDPDGIATVGIIFLTIFGIPLIWNAKIIFFEEEEEEYYKPIEILDRYYQNRCIANEYRNRQKK